MISPIRRPLERFGTNAETDVGERPRRLGLPTGNWLEKVDWQDWAKRIPEGVWDRLKDIPPPKLPEIFSNNSPPGIRRPSESC